MQAGKKIIIDYLRMNMGHHVTEQDIRRIGLLDPLLDFVVRGKLRLQKSHEVDLASMRQVLNRLIRIPGCVDSVETCGLAEIRYLPDEPDYYAVMAVHLAVVEYGTVLEGLGERKSERLLSLMRIVFGSNFNRLLAGDLAVARNHFGTDVMLGTLLFPYVLMPTVLIGYMVMGHETGILRIAPWLRHMAQVIPVGAVSEDPFNWIVLSG